MRHRENFMLTPYTLLGLHLALCLSIVHYPFAYNQIKTL